jgi:hypothetical protein
MPTLVLNLFPMCIADLPGIAQGGECTRAGFLVIKESL